MPGRQTTAVDQRRRSASSRSGSMPVAQEGEVGDEQQPELQRGQDQVEAAVSAATTARPASG